MLIREGIIEPVVQHAVVNLGIAHAVAPTPAQIQIGREVHVLHSAGDSAIEMPEHYLLRGTNHGLSAGTADPVDRHGRHRYRQSGVDRSLARRVHLGAGLDHLTQDHVLHILGCQARAAQGLRNNGSTELWCRHALECATVSADGCAYRGAENDVGFLHD